MRQPFFFLLLLASCAWSAFAHEVRPAYLQVRQTGSNTYEIFWKVPAQGDLRLSLHVELPQSCWNLTEPRGLFSAGAFSENWSIRCEGGLPGDTIHIDGLTATLTDVLVRIERMDGSTQVTRLTSSVPSFEVEARAGGLKSHEHILRWASSTSSTVWTICYLCLVCCCWWAISAGASDRQRIHPFT